MKTLLFLSGLVFMASAKNIGFDYDSESLMKDEGYRRQDFDDVMRYDDNDDVMDYAYEKRNQHTKERLQERCKATDNIACYDENNYKERCHLYRVRYQLCPHVCNECKKISGQPVNPICDKSYKFGCCYDGTEANDMHTNCPVCEDKRPCIFQQKYRCTNGLESSRMLRKLCPVLCDMCDKNGNDCVDKDPEKCGNATPTICKGNPDLQLNCTKSCNLCPNVVSV